MRAIFKKLSFLLISGALFFSNICPSYSEVINNPKHFVFIHPAAEKGHSFFDEFQAIMKAAAKDLGDDLQVIYSDGDPYKVIDIAKSIAEAEVKPDCVLFMSLKGWGDRVLKMLNEAGIDSFIVNAGLTDKQYKKFGDPRGGFKYWLGQMLPDDEAAGYMLAQKLYNDFLNKNPEWLNEDINVIAIEGTPTESSSVQRLKGLQRFADEHSNFKILQIVKGKWDKSIAYKIVKHLFKRYDKPFNIVWSVTDDMAIGAAEAFIEKGLTPKEDVFIGGVDWSKNGLKEIEADKLNVSVGGHFFEGAWALVMLHDYYNGYDFKDSEGLKMHSPMYIVDKGNLEQVKKIIGDRSYTSVDFRKFSKHYNPDIKDYNFNIFDISAN